MSNYQDRWQTVKVNVEEGIAWVTLNRPEKRNAMSPTLNREMIDVLETIELDQEAHVLVLTGEGESFSAGMDLKEYFREIDASPEIVQVKVRRDASTWQWKLLCHYAKPTIAMVNGWCFGGAFSPLVACDLAIAADESVFGLSEINWGIPRQPGEQSHGRYRGPPGSALLHHDRGNIYRPQAAKMGLVNKSVPLTELREATRELAATLRDKNPVVLRAAKIGFKMCRELTWEQNEEYLYAKLDQAQQLDPEQGREQGLKQFLDEKSIKPGLESYHR